MRQLKIQRQITARESQSIGKYFQEIGKVGLVAPDKEDSPHEEVRLSLARLTKKESDVIFLYFGLDGPAAAFGEITHRYNLSRERVRQIKQNGSAQTSAGNAA